MLMAAPLPVAAAGTATYSVESSPGSGIVGGAFTFNIYITGTSGTTVGAGEVTLQLPTQITYGSFDASQSSFYSFPVASSSQSVSIGFATGVTTLTGKLLLGTVITNSQNTGNASILLTNGAADSGAGTPISGISYQSTTVTVLPQPTPSPTPTPSTTPLPNASVTPQSPPVSNVPQPTNTNQPLPAQNTPRMALGLAAITPKDTLVVPKENEP